MQTIRNASRSLAEFFLTLFFFTKSDIKTTIVPVTVFAAAAAPIAHVSKLPHVMFWIWLHLLQFDVSNQSIDPAEDTSNKADRPIPSGRITLRRARLLRWILVPLCFLLSISYSAAVLKASLAMAFLTILYNELHAHAGHWLVRNVMNAAGLMSFELGATLISGQDSNTLDSTAKFAIALSGGILATTYHAQDFKDREGDRKIGRRTIPIVMPAFSRFTVIVPLVIWSLSLGKVWELETVAATAFLALAFVIGGRFLFLRSVSDDQMSFYLYNVWISVAHALPAYWRHNM